MDNQIYSLICIGGGAAGFFGAINFAESFQKTFQEQPKTLILERSNQLLTKVRISGGGRCNVTNKEEEPKELIKNYPRGERNLINGMFAFGPSQMKNWLTERGLALKTEDDGRVFPASNSSQSVIDLFMNQAKKYNVEVQTSSKIIAIEKIDDYWLINTQAEKLKCHNILFATGSSKSGHSLAQYIGHEVTALAPSLFSFKIDTKVFKKLPGISSQNVKLKLKIGKKSFEQQGPVLITHWGLSGPAIIKLSAFAALEFAQEKYQARLTLNWLPDHNADSFFQELKREQKTNGKKQIYNMKFELIPKRFWHEMLESLDIPNQCFSEIKDKSFRRIAEGICSQIVDVYGKGEFKEEFVTCGGVPLKEINPKTFESKLVENVYFAGEVLNIDGITGGLNFQSAWTAAYLASEEMIRKFASQA